MEPLYNEVLGTMKNYLVISGFSLYEGKKQRNIKSWDQQNDLVIRGFVISDLFITRFHCTVKKALHQRIKELETWINPKQDLKAKFVNKKLSSKILNPWSWICFGSVWGPTSSVSTDLYWLRWTMPCQLHKCPVLGISVLSIGILMAS